MIIILFGTVPFFQKQLTSEEYNDIKTGIEGDTLSQKNSWEQKIAPALRRPGLEKTDGYYRVIVEFSSKRTDEVYLIIKTHQGRIYRQTGIIPGVTAEVPFAVIPVLARSKQVKRIWLDSSIKIC